MSRTDPRTGAPGRDPALAIVAGAVAIAAGMTIIVAVGSVFGTPLLIPPLAASLALIVGAPSLPIAQPRNVVVGHLASALVGVGCAALLSASPWTGALAGGIAFAVMLVLRAAHSPGVATAVLAGLGLATGDGVFLAAVTASSVGVCAMGLLVNRARRIRYPRYWW